MPRDQAEERFVSQPGGLRRLAAGVVQKLKAATQGGQLSPAEAEKKITELKKAVTSNAKANEPGGQGGKPSAKPNVGFPVM